MNWFQSLFFGLLSGLSDVLPVSSQAHKVILLKIFGVNEEAPVLRLLIHIAILAALYYSCSNQILRISRQLRLSRIPKKKRKRPLDVRTLMEFRLLRMMVIPVLVGLLAYNRTAPWGTKLNLMAIFALLNGVILYLPNLLPSGNKDARSMSALDGLLIGLSGAVSVVPGISSIAGATSVASVCGEIDAGAEFYSYDAKYISDNSRTLIPARITEEQAELVREAAVKVFLAMGCQGLSRVDFFVTYATGEVVFNEINTIPGFTSISMYPKLFDASGIPCPELIDQLLQCAMEAAN